jgi:predicted ATPase/DNA-binding CsgD family transcriptional regulator
VVIAVCQSAASAAGGGVHGFASALTSFVGRAGPVAEVAGLLGECRLVTVTGPGGSGKTRLAGEVAKRVAGRFADGVWLAELAAVRDPAQVAAAVAATLGVRDLPGASVEETLAAALSQYQHQLLLVLDNCEHVIDAAAALCARLLTTCGGVRVLATSREPLRVAGEARYRLAPLALPDPDDLAGAVRAEAVALFADRARVADVRFVLDDQTGPAVARLVTRLDGMPLAIELAAARVETLGVVQLLNRLDDRFDLLTMGDRTAAVRQRSLEATVQWSYRLLDEREQRMFRLISVFQGPFTLEAAEALAGEGAGPLVLRLVDCSVLAPPQVGPDGRSRYVMLETLRGYGNRRLAEAGEQEQAAAALARYALAVATQAADGLQAGTTELAAAQWLDAEDATTRQALAWALDHDAGTASQLAVALAPWWQLRGRFVTEYPLLREAARQAEPGSDAWCVAQCWLGLMAHYFAGPPQALGHFTAVRDAIGDRPPSRVLADCLSGRSGTLANLGRIDEAADDARRALAVARELGYPAGEAMALVDLAAVAFYAGDFGGAVRLARQAKEIPADIPGWIARSVSNIVTGALTLVGDLATAELSCTAGLARARDAGDLRNLAMLLIRMAFLDLLAGRIEDAAKHLRQSLQVVARTGGRAETLSGLDCCGHLCAATGRPAEAMMMWAAGAALSRQYGFTDPPAAARHRAEPLDRARHTLGGGRARAAEGRGAAMTTAAAAQYALTLATHRPQCPGPPGPVGLSARECELVTLVAQGSTDSQIAAKLFISVRTVSSHLDRIRAKTGCRRRADLTRLALTVGLA